MDLRLRPASPSFSGVNTSNISFPPPYFQGREWQFSEYYRTVMAHGLSLNQVSLNGVSVNVAEGGTRGKRPILFLHGYPQNNLAFKDVMMLLRDSFHLFAIDLPGIGLSWPIPAGDKKTIAQFIHEFVKHQHLDKFILCGHDVGGMTAYSYMRQFPESLAGTVIMNTAIPGLPPWDDVKRNPHIWHFAFYAIPTLPETLILGKERPLFDYFFDTISSNKKLITAQKRAEYTSAYQKPESLKTSLDWYRSFVHDERDNADTSPVHTPLLYLRGDKEFGDIQNYVNGFHRHGIMNLFTQIITSSGHFAPDENPGEVAKAIRTFAARLG